MKKISISKKTKRERNHHPHNSLSLLFFNSINRPLIIRQVSLHKIENKDNTLSYQENEKWVLSSPSQHVSPFFYKHQSKSMKSQAYQHLLWERGILTVIFAAPDWCENVGGFYVNECVSRRSTKAKMKEQMKPNNKSGYSTWVWCSQSYTTVLSITSNCIVVLSALVLVTKGLSSSLHLVSLFLLCWVVLWWCLVVVLSMIWNLALELLLLKFEDWIDCVQSCWICFLILMLV